jgi:protein transport protein SEC61 subunit gamma-like protein
MKIVEKSQDAQKVIESRFKQIGKGKYGRVIKMARKPTRDEYMKTLKITGVGLALIGALGFLIYWLWDNVPKLLGS